MGLRAVVLRHDPDRCNRVIEQADALLADQVSGISLQESRWGIALEVKPVAAAAWDITVDFECIEGAARAASLMLEFECTGWDESRHVLLPGAAYQGNRFLSRKIPYSPKLWFD